MGQMSDTDWNRIFRGVFSQNEADLIASEGIYRGGDELVNHCLPTNSILNADIDSIIAAGTKAMSHRLINLIDEHEVAKRIWNAAEERRGFSLVRLGDGELLTLAQDTVYTIDEIKFIGSHFLTYAGLNVPDLAARDALISSVQQADIVGVPSLRRITFQNLFRKVANHYNLPIENMPLTTSVINYVLEKTALYHRLFTHFRVLLIGNRMAELREHLTKYGYQSIVGVLPLAGTKAVDEVLEQTSHSQYDVAIVAGGIAASILCPLISRNHKVAIDFGHLADELLYDNRTFKTT